MAKMGYGYGSEWHLLRYLGYHRNELDKKIIESTGGQRIEWLDSRFKQSNKPLQDDQEWERMDFIDDKAVQEKWQRFWPRTGTSQNWDAIGKLYFDGETHLLLVEAKAHLKELESQCGAGNNSKEIIRKAFADTRAWMGVDSPIEHWFNPYYQYCN